MLVKTPCLGSARSRCWHTYELLKHMTQCRLIMQRLRLAKPPDPRAESPCFEYRGPLEQGRRYIEIATCTAVLTSIDVRVRIGVPDGGRNQRYGQDLLRPDQRQKTPRSPPTTATAERMPAVFRENDRCLDERTMIRHRCSGSTGRSGSTKATSGISCSISEATSHERSRSRRGPPLR